MPKPNKPRASAPINIVAAKRLLAEYQINPSEVTQAAHFADGSMSILMQRGDDQWHLGIEFSPKFTSDIANALRAVGVPVERSIA
jgi:hypothetical protein